MNVDYTWAELVFARRTLSSGARALRPALGGRRDSRDGIACARTAPVVR